MLAEGRTGRPDPLRLAPQVALIVATLALASGTLWTGPAERAVFLVASVALTVMGSALWWRTGRPWLAALADAVFVLAGIGVLGLNQPSVSGVDGDFGPGLFRDAERLVGAAPGGVAPPLWSTVGIVWVIAGTVGLVLIARTGRRP